MTRLPEQRRSRQSRGVPSPWRCICGEWNHGAAGIIFHKDDCPLIRQPRYGSWQWKPRGR